MNQRPYQGDRDLQLLQDFNAVAFSETSGCGYLHPGDIPHRLFNANKLFDPSEVMTIWEDERGVAAWVMIGPRHKGYDAQVRPDLRANGFEREVLQYADYRTVELMRQHHIEGDRIYTDVYQCDPVRSGFLLELGWELGSRSEYVLNRTKILQVENIVLPDGYRVRAVRDTSEAAKVAGVHAASFGSQWTADLYRKVMESPGYAPEREFVIEAPDGTFAAFTVTWHDPLNSTGYFEPVGTHQDHRRCGLGRAIVLYGMQQMAAAGMEFALVATDRDNIPAMELYKACGFKPWHVLDGYTKGLTGVD